MKLTSGIELAARFVEKRRDDYVQEHGSYDPSTGVTEFPGDGEEYVGELEEIIEGIRALAAAPASAAEPVRVKPLKWETYAGDKAVGEQREHYGFHEFGYYIITKDVTPERQYWHLSTFTNRGHQRHIASFPKLSEAKETAQTDFDAQVAITIDT